MKAHNRGIMVLLCGTLLSGTPIISTVQAQEPGSEQPAPGQTNVADKIGTEYSDFLGDNTEVVVTGLRDGSEITLPTDSGTTSFTPPTGKMGYGNVSLSLGLAQEQLAQYGITQPTSEELQAALVGGEISTASGGTAQLDGVLTLRSQGMGWGEIAHEYGVKLGHVISTVKSGKPHVLTETQAQPADAGSTATGTTTSDAKSSNQGKGHAYGKGIVTGSGAPASEGGVNAGATKSSGKQGHAYGQGIVTGGGASVTPGTSSAGDGARGNAYGHGIVSGGGAPVTPGSTGTAHGAGGNAYGHDKGGGK